MAENGRSAVFLDRDGVLNALVDDPRTGNAESPLREADVELLPGAVDAIKRLRRGGHILVGVTNQPAAAKGVVEIDQLLEVHARVVSLLAADGAALDAWRLCLHHPEGVVEELTKVCECRKPRPGMLIDAANELDLDLHRSWIIGDTDADIAAGSAAGCRTILVEEPASVHKRRGAAAPGQFVPDLWSAALLITPDS